MKLGFRYCWGVMTKFLAVFQPGDTPPYDPFFSASFLSGPCNSCCSVRFEQVEPPDAGEFVSPNRLNRQREKMDSGCRFVVLEECG